jgi:hypothetical protein
LEGIITQQIQNLLDNDLTIVVDSHSNSKPLFDTKSIPAPENILATTAPHYSDIIAGNSKPLLVPKSIPAPENILATSAPHYSDITV